MSLRDLALSFGIPLVLSALMSRWAYRQGYRRGIEHGFCDGFDEVMGTVKRVGGDMLVLARVRAN